MNQDIIAAITECGKTDDLSMQPISLLRQICIYLGSLQHFKKIKEFQNSFELLMLAAQSLKIDQFKRGEIICRQHDRGDKCYIVLNGEVGVYVEQSQKNLHKMSDVQVRLRQLQRKYESLTGKEAENEKQLVKKEIQSSEEELQHLEGLTEEDKQMISNSTESSSFIASVEVEDLGEKLEISQYLIKRVNKLNSNSLFGEFSLAKVGKRTATVIALSDNLTTAYIPYEKYNVVFDSVIKYKESIAAQITMFFPQIGDTYANQLSYLLTDINLNRKEVLFEEGDKNEDLYYLEEGTIQLTKKQKDPGLSPLKDCSNLGQFGQHYKQKKVAILQPCQFFGYEQIHQKCFFTATAGSDNTKILWIQRKHMKQLQEYNFSKVLTMHSEKRIQRYIERLDQMNLAQKQLLDKQRALLFQQMPQSSSTSKPITPRNQQVLNSDVVPRTQSLSDKNSQLESAFSGENSDLIRRFSSKKKRINAHLTLAEHKQGLLQHRKSSLITSSFSGKCNLDRGECLSNRESLLSSPHSTFTGGLPILPNSTQINQQSKQQQPLSLNIPSTFESVEPKQISTQKHKKDNKIEHLKGEIMQFPETFQQVKRRIKLSRVSHSKDEVPTFSQFSQSTLLRQQLLSQEYPKFIPDSTQQPQSSQSLQDQLKIQQLQQSMNSFDQQQRCVSPTSSMPSLNFLLPDSPLSRRSIFNKYEDSLEENDENIIKSQMFSSRQSLDRCSPIRLSRVFQSQRSDEISPEKIQETGITDGQSYQQQSKLLDNSKVVPLIWNKSTSSSQLLRATSPSYQETQQSQQSPQKLKSFQVLPQLNIQRRSKSLLNQKKQQEQLLQSEELNCVSESQQMQQDNKLNQNQLSSQNLSKSMKNLMNSNNSSYNNSKDIQNIIIQQQQQTQFSQQIMNQSSQNSKINQNQFNRQSPINSIRSSNNPPQISLDSQNWKASVILGIPPSEEINQEDTQKRRLLVSEIKLFKNLALSQDAVQFRNNNNRSQGISPRKIALGQMKSILEEKNKEEDEEDGISVKSRRSSSSSSQQNNLKKKLGISLKKSLKECKEQINQGNNLKDINDKEGCVESLRKQSIGNETHKKEYYQENCFELRNKSSDEAKKKNRNQELKPNRQCFNDQGDNNNNQEINVSQPTSTTKTTGFNGLDNFSVGLQKAAIEITNNTNDANNNSNSLSEDPYSQQQLSPMFSRDSRVKLENNKELKLSFEKIKLSNDQKLDLLPVQLSNRSSKSMINIVAKNNNNSNNNSNNLATFLKSQLGSNKVSPLKELCLFGEFHQRNSYALTARNDKKSIDIGLKDDNQTIIQPLSCYNNAMYQNPNELFEDKKKNYNNNIRHDEGFVQKLKNTLNIAPPAQIVSQQQVQFQQDNAKQNQKQPSVSLWGESIVSAERATPIPIDFLRKTKDMLKSERIKTTNSSSTSKSLKKGKTPLFQDNIQKPTTKESEGLPIHIQSFSPRQDLLFRLPQSRQVSQHVNVSPPILVNKSSSTDNLIEQQPQETQTPAGSQILQKTINFRRRTPVGSLHH